MAKRQKTFVSFLLDETGSMGSVRDATISGFNEYIDTLKAEDGDALFTLTLFNSKHITTRHKSVPLKDVPHLNRDTYRPDAITPLYDAIAAVIRDTEDATSAEEDKPAVLVAIMTDGLENASKEYTRQQIFDLIQRKEGDGWTFAYLGANQDAWAVGESIGVRAGNTFTYNAVAPDAAMARLADATVSYMRREPDQTDSLFDEPEKKRKKR